MSEDNVTQLKTYTTRELDPDKVLKAAIGEVNPVLIVGEDKEGSLYMASSVADKGEILLLLERARLFLLLNT
jgi:hypothetical protein